MSPVVLPQQTGQVITVPADVWRAGSASRAAALGRLATPVEAIAAAGRTVLQRSPSLLRRIGRLPGAGILAPLLFLEAVEWASEWVRDSLIPSLRSWEQPTQTGTYRLGYRFEIEGLDYGPLGFPDGSPVVYTEVSQVAPSTGIGSIISIDQPPAYRERPGFGGVGWEFVMRTTQQGGNPAQLGAITSFVAKSRYRFRRILDWQIIGLPASVPRQPRWYDPEQGVDPDGLAPPSPVPPLPLSVPLADPPTLPIPGDLTIWTPAIRGVPGERFDLDWVPRRQNNPSLQRVPGLRVGFRPWGVIIAELAADLIGDVLLDPSRIDLDVGTGECPDPCPELDYDRIKTIAQDALDERFPPSRFATLQSVNYGPANSFSIPLPPFPRRAIIEVTECPINTRSQPGGADAPDVFYLGWYSVSRFEGAGGDRRPIHYKKQSVDLENRDQFLTLTFYAGTLGTVQIDYFEEP